MQPVALAIDVNPRFIGMIDIGLRELILGCLFERRQLGKAWWLKLYSEPSLSGRFS